MVIAAPPPPLPLPHAHPNPHASPMRNRRTRAVPWTRSFPALGLSRGRLALDLAIARRRRHRPALATTGRSSLLPPAALAHAHPNCIAALEFLVLRDTHRNSSAFASRPHCRRARPPSAALQHRLRLIAVVRAHRPPAYSTDSYHRLRLHRHLLPVPAAREGKELRPGPGFRLLSRVESSPDLVRTAPRFHIIHTTPCSSILFSILITRPNSIHGLRFPTVCLDLWQPFRILITQLRPSLDPCSTLSYVLFRFIEQMRFFYGVSSVCS